MTYGDTEHPHAECRERIAELEAEVARFRRDHEAMECLRTYSAIESMERLNVNWYVSLHDGEEYGPVYDPATAILRAAGRE